MTDAPDSNLPPGSQKNPLALASMICGIVSLPMLGCCGVFALPMALIGIVTGGLSLANIKKDPSLDGRTQAIVGIATGALNILLCGAFILVYGGLVGFAMLEQL